MRGRPSAVSFVFAAALVSATSARAQTATPGEAQSPLLVLQHLPHAPSHDRMQA